MDICFGRFFFDSAAGIACRIILTLLKQSYQILNVEQRKSHEGECPFNLILIK